MNNTNTNTELTGADWQDLINFNRKVELFKGDYSDIAQEFVLLMHDKKIIVEGFHWTKFQAGELWMKDDSESKYEMLNDKTFTAKLITALVCQDRFATGSIARWFELGVMQKILQKLITI